MYLYFFYQIVVFNLVFKLLKSVKYYWSEYYLQTKSCGPVDGSAVDQEYYLQTIYLEDQVLSIPISNIFIMVSQLGKGSGVLYILPAK